MIFLRSLFDGAGVAAVKGYIPVRSREDDERRPQRPEIELAPRRQCQRGCEGGVVPGAFTFGGSRVNVEIRATSRTIPPTAVCTKLTRGEFSQIDD